jgi:hypothetical protein
VATCVALAAIPKMVLLPIAWVRWRSEDGRVDLVWADKVSILLQAELRYSMVEDPPGWQLLQPLCSCRINDYG